MNLDDQFQQHMTSVEKTFSSNKKSFRLLKKIFKSISKKYGFKLDVFRYSSGEVCILSENMQIIPIHNKVKWNNLGIISFKSANELLDNLMDKNTTLNFEDAGINDENAYSFAKNFGTSINEIMINLDLNYK